MKKLRLLQNSAVAAVALIASIGFAYGADNPVSLHTLDNGLRVVISEDSSSPTASIVVFYHVGSKNEKPGIRGFAHFFEHLMFNGSEHHNGPYQPDVINAGGTNVGGSTSRDYTVYHQVVPKNGLERVLWLESDRMGYLLGAIDEAKLNAEREVVKNEIGMVHDEPGAMALYRQMASFYPSEHPYSWRPLGVLEEVNAASMDDFRQWFNDFYGAANAVISIVGDVKTDETLALVNKYFGSVRSGPPVTRSREWVVGPSANLYEEMFDKKVQAPIC